MKTNADYLCALLDCVEYAAHDARNRLTAHERDPSLLHTPGDKADTRRVQLLEAIKSGRIEIDITTGRL